MDSTSIILTISFFFIALIYSSVGFGGGSSYLALMATMAIPFTSLKPAALLCNIIVVTGGTLIFYGEGKLDLKKCWPFIAASVPLAFVGGYWKLSESSFFVVLGATLIVAAILLWIQPENVHKRISNNLPTNAAIGGAIGFVSGLVGIGGGIFLSPILHLMKWDDAKRISALASLFILVNSIGGLAGQMSRSADVDWLFIVPLLIAVLAGGQIGSRIGSRKFSAIIIKRITAVLILIAGINILREHLIFL
jgi:uncharacterized membrane protein YfcA